MADNMNHKDVNVLCEILTKSLHKKGTESGKYFTKAKFMNNFSQVFTKDEQESYPDILGRFNK